MKKKKVLVMMLALIAAALFIWRGWPHTLREILNANDEPFDTISYHITEFGIADGSPKLDTYEVKVSSDDGADYDQVLSLVEGTKFRQDLRNLLPWDINTVSSGPKNITHSANLMLTGAGCESACYITYHGSRTVAFSMGPDTEFRVYHPTNRSALDQLVAYAKEHGVLIG